MAMLDQLTSCARTRLVDSPSGQQFYEIRGFLCLHSAVQTLTCGIYKGVEQCIQQSWTKSSDPEHVRRYQCKYRFLEAPCREAGYHSLIVLELLELRDTVIFDRMMTVIFTPPLEVRSHEFSIGLYSNYVLVQV
jgi:hypothetical protein